MNETLYLAPLAGITDTIFRVIAKRYGAGLVFSEMINSNGVLRGGVSLLQKLDIHPDEGSVGIQIAGDDPHTMAEAARLAVDAGASTININMGCPVKKVTRNQAGCALMKNPLLVKDVIRTIKSAIDVPLTIKIRLGWDDNSMNYVEIAQIAQEEGCAAVFMHARTRKAAFKGEARWEEITRLKEAMNIPVIGNGDITSYEKGIKMMKQTGCDGVMIGRGALGRPWIFRQIQDHQSGRPVFQAPPEEIRDLIIEHLERSCERYGEKLGLRLMQKHFVWYTKGIPRSSEFRQTIHQQKTPEEATICIKDFFNRQEPLASSL